MVVERLIQQQLEVISAESRYIGDKTEPPTHKEVCKKITGHAEAVEVVYDFITDFPKFGIGHDLVTEVV